MQYRADPANGPRTFNYENGTLEGIIVADAIGSLGGGATIKGALISLSRLAATIGTGAATIKHHDRNIAAAKAYTGYKKKNGTFRQLTTQ